NVQTPYGDAGTSFRTQVNTFDVIGRVLTNSTTAGSQSILVTNHWDREGRLFQVDRMATGSTGGPGSLTDSYVYDLAGRQTSETPPGGPAIIKGYDEAGNLISVQNRRGQTVTMQYDKLNRLLTRNAPSVAYAQQVVSDPNIAIYPHPAFTAPAIND